MSCAGRERARNLEQQQSGYSVPFYSRKGGRVAAESCFVEAASASCTKWVLCTYVWVTERLPLDKDWWCVGIVEILNMEKHGQHHTKP